MFYKIKNLRSNDTEILELPWEWKPPAPRPSFATKAEWTAWCSNPDTEWCFFSGVEGLSPRVRVADKGDNPPAVIHATVMDYDMQFEPVPDIARMKAKPPSEFMPAWACRTESGHLRLIWLHESPINVSTCKQVELFRKVQLKKMKLARWYGGLDDKSHKAQQYFEIGKDWFPVCPDARIPSAMLHAWLYEASRGLSLVEGHSYAVPIEEVAKEVERRFPGRWQGSFALGSQGVRFWDPQADNQRAAVVHEEGMVCFTGSRAFVSWKDIFGAAFVEQFEGERLQKIAETLLYDEVEDKFWILEEVSGKPAWVRMASERINDRLRVMGFHGTPKKGETASEVNRIRDYVVKNNRVVGARPFVFMPHGPIHFNGDRVLNTCRIRVIEPAPEGTVRTIADLRKYAPMITEWFFQFLEPRPTCEEVQQTEYLLAWLKHFYQNAYLLRPQPGQALILVGEKEGTGKSYLVSCFAKVLFGGSTDASGYLVNGSQFTESALSSPIMVVDDTESASDYKKHDRFSAIVKKVTANRVHSFNGKYKGVGDVIHTGRTIICCNMDPQSIQSIPAMDISVFTKVSLLKVNAFSNFSFPRGLEIIDAQTRKEMPYFARFLLEWQVPEHLINLSDNRYFLKPYHHPELYKTAVRAGRSHAILEILEEFMEDYARHAENLGKTHWRGTASALFREINMVAGLDSLMRGYDAMTLGKAMAVLKSQGYNIEQDTKTKYGNKVVWILPLTIENVTDKIAREREEELQLQGLVATQEREG